MGVYWFRQHKEADTNDSAMRKPLDWGIPVEEAKARTANDSQFLVAANG